MKKFIYLFLSAVIATTTFTACSSSSSDNDSNNDGGGEGTTNSITGSWEPVRQYGFIEGQEFYNMPYPHECSSQKDYVIFNAGGTFTDYEFTENCEPIIEEGTYVRDGNSLTITMSVEEYERNYKVISVTSTKMIFEVVNLDIEDEEDDINMAIRIEFKKK